MKYIDLFLEQHSQDSSELTNKDTNKYFLDQIVDSSKVSVILGSPGSGKTTIMKKFNTENKTAQLSPINKFLRPTFVIGKHTEILLLDGLDEYKSTQSDKSTVIDDVADKIKKLDTLKVVITCRQTDWFGDSETKSLNDSLNEEVKVFNILKLDRNKKIEFAQLWDISDSGDFIRKFDSFGFLENPQMFKMIAEIYNSDSYKAVKSKTSLYLQFIKHAAEKNEVYVKNQINELEGDELIRLTGYLSFFTIFSNFHSFDKNTIIEIASKENGYSMQSLNTALKSNLFSDNQFIHRTISEFSTAYFIKQYKYKNEEGLNLERIKSIFTVDGKVPTSLKGTFAWLCSLTKNEQLFDLDPFNLMLNGDCDSFSAAEKILLLESIKKLSDTNPNFVLAGDYYGYNPSDFYQVELDTFLLEAISKLNTINSEYDLLIYKIICSSVNLSPNIVNILEKQFLDSTIDNSIRYQLINVFKKNQKTLVNVLNEIQQNKFENDDGVIDELLNLLYPQTIDNGQIVDYLLLYKDKVIGHHMYLYSSKNKDKHILVDSIFSEIFKNEQPNLILLNNLKSFLNDYLLETLLEFEKTLTAEKIYQIFNELKSYEPSDGYFKTHFELSSFRQEINVEKDLNNLKLKRLVNSLFEIFVEKKLKKNELPTFFDFSDIFLRGMRPQNIFKTLLNHINHSCSSTMRKNLFSEAFRCCPEEARIDKEVIKEFEITAQKYNITDDWKLLCNPKIPYWKLEEQKRAKEIEIENQKQLEQNELYFAQLTDEEIISDSSILFRIASNYFNMQHYKTTDPDCLTKTTFLRLVSILKKLIFHPLNTGKENLKSLAESTTSTSCIRKIDMIYYVSCALNQEIKFDQINQDLSKYLYMLSLIKQSYVNTIKGNFIEQYHSNKDDEIATIKEYFKYKVKFTIPEFSSLFNRYIEQETGINKLKSISILHFRDDISYENEIINAFIATYSFEISKPDLIKLKAYKGLNVDNFSVLKVMLSIEDNTIHVTEKDLRIYFRLFDTSRNFFNSIPITYKVRIINQFMNHVKRALKIKSGQFDELEHFIRDKGIYKLGIDGVDELYQLRKNKNDSWSKPILRERDRLKQELSNKSHKPHTIEKLRDYIFNDTILDKKDFFTDFCIKLNALKDDIEANRDQQKDQYYKLVKSSKPKIENECRDTLLIRLKDLYKNEFEFSPEKQESQKTRVDINVKYKNNPNFEIQIECKRDSNRPDVYTGIPDQLIKKYLSKGVEYGVYLIFYFGSLKNKRLLLNKINCSIPTEYKDKIKVILIDLTYN